MRNGRDGNNLVNWQVFGGSEANLDGGHINEIYLMNNNLSGTIMTGLLYLPYVTVWGLGGNSISAVNTEALT
ncbi:hypothetical protein KBC03_08210 [Patescibacteria group bacterium]|nr:hypothetical protein [Patescibacteria group bacterium]